MGYREEKEALRARADAMEQELGQVRGELSRAQQELEQARQRTPWERVEQLERDLAAAQQAVRELRTQMTATTRPPAPAAGRGPVVAAAAVGLALIGAGAAVFLVSKPAPPVRVAPPPPIPVATPQPRDVAGGVVGGVAGGVDPSVDAPIKEERVTARWGGAITSSSGLGLAAGTRCQVEAELLRTEGGETKISVESLAVRCGGKQLYSSRDELNGVSMTSAGVTEEKRPTSDGPAYAILYQDTGDRTGARSQINLRTDIGQAKIWNDGLQEFEARLRLDRLSGGPGAAGAPVTSGKSPLPR